MNWTHLHVEIEQPINTSLTLNLTKSQNQNPVQEYHPNLEVSRGRLKFYAQKLEQKHQL